MKMKIGYIKIFVIICLTFVFNCSSNKEEQSQEIRFVDLQGNPKAIKTRVPEANARIMSGQATNLNDYSVNKKNFVEAPSYYNKNATNQKNIVSPKFSDSDNYNKNAPTINYKDEAITSSETQNQINETASEDPVVEYDLSKDDGKGNKNASKKNLVQRESIESDDLEPNSSNKSSAINSSEEVFVEEDQFVESSSKNTNLKNKRALNKNGKIISYSDRNIKKISNQKKRKSGAVIQSDNLEETQYSSESYQKIYRGGGGRIYVQVGSFFTSKGAKERLILTKQFGKGRVLVAYNKNNKRIYRSVYGPFKSKNSAINFRDKIIESGNEAIIIRGK